MVKVLAVCGSSGGHIYPAVSFLESLKEKGADTLLVLPGRAKGSAAVSSLRVKYISTSEGKYRLKFSPGGVIAAFNFLKGSLESLFLLVEYKPDIVAGFGSVDSIPMVFFAWLMRIKTLIHEQNVVPGRANMLLSKFADKIAVSFPETKDYLPVCADKCALTGNPVRKSLEVIDRKDACAYFGFSAQNPVALVFGGSQGSASINKYFIRLLEQLPQKNILQVIHICGKKDFALLNDFYRSSGVPFKLYPFFERMDYAYSAASFAIARAGATTIAELIRFRKPAVLIPYPYAYEHQLKNAQVLERCNCALIVKETGLESGALEAAVAKILSEPGQIANMEYNYGQITRLAGDELLAGEALALAAS